MKTAKFTKINIETYEGNIPSNSELVIAETGDEIDSSIVLYGFDEIDLFKSEFKNPVFGFLS